MLMIDNGFAKWPKGEGGAGGVGMTGITYPVCAALSAGGKSRAQCAAACADRPTHSW